MYSSALSISSFICKAFFSFVRRSSESCLSMSRYRLSECQFHNVLSLCLCVLVHFVQVLVQLRKHRLQITDGLFPCVKT